MPPNSAPPSSPRRAGPPRWCRPCGSSTTAPVIGPHDSIVVISHTGETAYALAARALAFEHSIDTITITRRGRRPAPLDRDRPQGDLRDLHGQLHGDVVRLRDAGQGPRRRHHHGRAPRRDPRCRGRARSNSRASTASRPRSGSWSSPALGHHGHHRLGSGPEVPGGGPDRRRGLRRGVPAARPGRPVGRSRPPRRRSTLRTRRCSGPWRPPPRRPGSAVSTIHEPADLHPLLAQIPLSVRGQMLALRMAEATGQDPDTVMVGPWADDGHLARRRARVLSRPRQPAWVRRSERTNSRTAASSRNPTRACTTVPDGVVARGEHLRVPVQPRRQVLTAVGHQELHLHRRVRQPFVQREDEPVDPLARQRRHRHGPGVAAGQPGPLRAAHLVDLVQDQHLGDVARADLGQHPPDGVDLLVEMRRGRRRRCGRPAPPT